MEVPREGAKCDLFRSDPDENQGWDPSPRGAGYTFGPGITNQLSDENNLKVICRAHQLVMDGYSWIHVKQRITTFSAPIYCCR